MKKLKRAIIAASLSLVTAGASGSFNVQTADFSQIGNFDNSYFSSIQHKVSEPDKKGFYHKGPVKVREPKDNSPEAKELTLAKLDNQYNAYVQLLSIKGEVYKNLLNKSAEELSSGEKAFMSEYEMQAYNFINS